jgi:3-oxoacyl-[acyl-carrier protein] reductase
MSMSVGSGGDSSVPGPGRLSGKVALVTGAGHGIGRGIALAFAKAGADVGVNDLREDSAGAVLEEVHQLGRRGWLLPGDVSNEGEVKLLAEKLLNEAGGIDIVVANAGIAQTVPVLSMSSIDWDRMIAVHLRGTFLTVRYTIPPMVAAGRGKVITISSQLAYIGREGFAHYAAAKAGIIGFTKALARELGPCGINVNSIAPGPIETGLVQQDDVTRDRIRRALPLLRYGAVDDVAPTAVFLASSDSDYYTGQTLGPNGGDVML